MISIDVFWYSFLLLGAGLSSGALFAILLNNWIK